MALFTNRNSSPQTSAPAEGAADKVRANAGLVPSVEDLRRRARHRLIGSAVLVAAGVILFPLLFDAEPRTVSPSIPIVMDNKVDVAPVSASAPAAKVELGKSLDANEEVVNDAKPVAGKPLAAASVARLKEEPAAKKAEAAEKTTAADQQAEDKRKAEELRAAADKAAQDKKAAEKRVAEKKAQEQQAAEKKAAEKKAAEKKAADKNAAEEKKAAQDRAAEEKAAENADAEKQKALAEQKAKEAEQHKLAQQKAKEAEQRKLAEQKAKDGKEAVTYDFPDKGRFVVQVGAYVEDARVADVRRKLSGAGINNFTQKVKVDGKDVTRVRMGPFATRKEMERVAAKVKALGLPVSMYSY